MTTITRAALAKALVDARSAVTLRQVSTGGWELAGPAAPEPPQPGDRPTRARMQQAQLRLQTHFAMRRLLAPEAYQGYLAHPCHPGLGRIIGQIAKTRLPELGHLVWQQLTEMGVTVEPELQTHLQG